MNAIDFHCLLTNASLPARVILNATNIVIEIHEFNCDFSIICSGKSSPSYSVQNPSLTIEYNSIDEVLKLIFNLKEIMIFGKSQLHELSSVVEKQINILIFHSNIISSKIDSVIQELSSKHRISLKTLTHETSEVLIHTRSYGDISVKTQVKDHNLAIVSPLLTSRIFKHYYEMKRPMDLREVYELLAISAEFQMMLDDSLKEFSAQAFRPYVQGSFSMYGIVCIPNFYNEIHLCYMKEMMVSIRTCTFPYTLEVMDLAFFNSNLKKIRRFDGCLHHAMTKALKDPDLAGFKNTVESGLEGVYQILELHKPEHMKNTLHFLISYIQITYIFEACRTAVDDIVRVLKRNIVKSPAVYKMLDLRLELNCLEGCKYNVVLKMKDSTFGLEVDLDLEILSKNEIEVEKLERWKKIYIQYFNSSIKQYCKGNTELCVCFVKLFLVPCGLLGLITEIIDEELCKRLNIEFVWQSLMIRNDSLRFSIKVWDSNNKSLDIIFMLKETAEGRETQTNLDPNFMTYFNLKDCTPLEIITNVCSRRLEDLKFRQLPDIYGQ